MLHGFDISHHNGTAAVIKCVDAMNRKGMYPDFCFIKATEGKSYRDSRMERNIEDAYEYNLVPGLYHYARPELGNTTVEEAKNFLDRFNPYIGKAIPALDWEDAALTCNRNWARRWLDYVYEQTGVRPVLYISRSECHMHRETVEGNYGLWVAAWNEQKAAGNVSPWSTWAFHQYTSEPFDMNFFNGNREQLTKYCMSDKGGNMEIECECECHYCGCSCKAKR